MCVLPLGFIFIASLVPHVCLFAPSCVMDITHFPPFFFSKESVLYFRFFPAVFFSFSVLRFPRICVCVRSSSVSTPPLSTSLLCGFMFFFFPFLECSPLYFSYIYIYVRPPISVPHGLSCGDSLCLFRHAFFLSLLSRFLFSPLPPTRLCLFALWWYHVIAIYASIFSLDACVCVAVRV